MPWLTYISVRFVNMLANKWQIKLFFSMFSLLIITGIIIFTTRVANELIDKETDVIKAFTKTTEIISKSEIDPLMFEILKQLNTSISFPMIITDSNDVPLMPYLLYSKNIELGTSQSLKIQTKMMLGKVSEMRQKYPPIVSYDDENRIIQKTYYTDSQLIVMLKYFPYIALLAISFLILISYFILINIKKSEESKVWVGMAKEAAHQLGTPLSSILAWVEILRGSIDNPKQISDSLTEVDKDLNRLSIVANRFSKIGSIPKLQNVDVVELIQITCNYYRKRLPHLGRKVVINEQYDNQEYYLNLNSDLFTWVIENLIKNAVEASKSKQGQINISIKEIDNNIQILVQDNGKGMSSKVSKQIFKPGYTTKKRGWGLGLSLCHRIINEYHKGKIYIKQTEVNVGTTFAIELPIVRGLKI